MLALRAVAVLGALVWYVIEARDARTPARLSRRRPPTR